MKLRSDILFLLLAAPGCAVIILTELDMYELCEKEKEFGRAPRNIEFHHAPLPDDLATKLRTAKRVSSDEVSPLRRSTVSASGQ